MSLFHPLVCKAFDLCFKGCGHPEGLAGVIQNSAWEKLLKHYKSLPECLTGTELGSLFNAGPHRVGLEFCRSEGRDWAEVVDAVQHCQDRWQPNPDFLATVDYLQEELLNTAVGCLPTQFSKPKVQVADWSKLNLPLTPSQLADVWHDGDEDIRLLIAKLLAEVFVTAPNKKTLPRGRDILRQKPEYVLPGFFGPWDEESDYHPNCLGKDITLAAFARQAGIDALVVIPAQPCSRIKARFRGRLAQMCLAGFSRAGMPLLKRRRQNLEDIASVGRTVQDEPSWVHACIALPQHLDGSLWLLIDPNERMASVMPLDWALGTAFADLRNLEAVLPGLSFLKEDRDARLEDDFPEYRRFAKDNLEHLKIFAQDGFPSEATKLQIIERLVNSRLLDVAVTCLLDDGQCGYANPSFEPDTPRRYQAVCLLLEHIYRKCSKTGPQELQLKIDWRKITDYAVTEQMLFSKITDKEARQGLETLCFALGTRVLANLTSNYQTRQCLAELIHPQCQIGGAGYFLATSVLAHVAYCLGSRTSLQMESLLCHHAFDLHRLHVAAGMGVTHWKNSKKRQRALEALSILEELPFVLPSTERILPHLQKMRLLNQAGEREVITTVS